MVQEDEDGLERLAGGMNLKNLADSVSGRGLNLSNLASKLKQDNTDDKKDSDNSNTSEKK